MALDTTRSRVAVATFVAAAMAVFWAAAVAAPADAADLPPQPPLATVAASTGSAVAPAGYDGVVEALRQTVIAAQVPGAVIDLPVKVGDTVKAGQVLARLDARAAEQTAAAGAAQVQAARAAQEAATREYERQRQLFEKRYISQAALDRAEANFKAAQAQAAAQLASAGAARTQSGFYVVRAPYAGVVADVAVVLGDMAMPGRPLMTVYDPRALRVSAPVPRTVAAGVPAGAEASQAQVELPGAVAGRITPARVQILPTVDPATHTQEVRLELPPDLDGVAPGMFARVWLASSGEAAGERIFVPASAVVRRAELTAVYVVSPDGRPLLRQVRLGRPSGERVEVLAGLSAGEPVAVDPQAAARRR
jgi:RND family efflux transporter MFP subunit